jgi:hypothetical protein
MKNLEQKKADRFRFLNHAYELTDGDETPSVNMWEIGEKLGFTEDETQKIVDYLVGEGLIAYRAMGGEIELKHYGIVQVEEALSNPEKPTQYFPPINIIQVGQMFQSQIQQGSEGGKQTLTINESATMELHTLLSELKSVISSMNLSPQNQKDLAGEIATIEGQMQTSKPKKSIIKESLASLRNIFEQVGANVFAAKIVSILGSLG